MGSIGVLLGGLKVISAQDNQLRHLGQAPAPEVID